MKDFIKNLYKKHDPTIGGMFSFIGFMVLSPVETSSANAYFILLSIRILLFSIGCVEFIILLFRPWDSCSRGGIVMTTGIVLFVFIVKCFDNVHFTFILFPILLGIIGWVDLMVNLTRKLKNGDK